MCDLRFDKKKQKTAAGWVKIYSTFLFFLQFEGQRKRAKTSERGVSVMMMMMTSLWCNKDNVDDFEIGQPWLGFRYRSISVDRIEKRQLTDRQTITHLMVNIHTGTGTQTNSKRASKNANVPKHWWSEGKKCCWHHSAVKCLSTQSVNLSHFSVFFFIIIIIIIITIISSFCLMSRWGGRKWERNEWKWKSTELPWLTLSEILGFVQWR